MAAGLGFAAQAFAADAVTLQLKWVTQAQFGGYFVAKDKGFYDRGKPRRHHQSRAAPTSRPSR